MAENQPRPPARECSSCGDQVVMDARAICCSPACKQAACSLTRRQLSNASVAHYVKYRIRPDQAGSGQALAAADGPAGDQRGVEVGPGRPVIGRVRRAAECPNGDGKQDGREQQHHHDLDEGATGMGTDAYPSDSPLPHSLDGWCRNSAGAGAVAPRDLARTSAPASCQARTAGAPSASCRNDVRAPLFGGLTGRCGPVAVAVET